MTDPHDHHQVSTPSPIPKCLHFSSSSNSSSDYPLVLPLHLVFSHTTDIRFSLTSCFALSCSAGVLRTLFILEPPFTAARPSQRNLLCVPEQTLPSECFHSLQQRISIIAGHFCCSHHRNKNKSHSTCEKLSASHLPADSGDGSAKSHWTSMFQSTNGR